MWLCISGIQAGKQTNAMDISVLAAVGSFAVSERILKPKATVLVILGCILAYDLTTKTHDVSSLRVYRGKSLFQSSIVSCSTLSTFFSHRPSVIQAPHCWLLR